MTDSEAFEAWLTPRRGKICPPHPEDYWEVWQAALASERAKQAEPCGCRIGECESKKDRLCRMQAEIKEGGHQ